MPLLSFALSVALAMLLLCRPAAAALGALNAMLCWATTVAPAMFPFLVLLPALTGPAAARVYARLFGGATERLYRLPGSAAPVLAAAMLGGSPAGTLACRRARGLNRGEWKRLALCACGFSPAFLMGGVGAGMLGDASLGRVLLRAQVAAQLLTPLLLRRAWRGETEKVFPLDQREEEQPVRAAVAAVLAVCGWMTLFGALGGATRALAGDRTLPILCLADAVTGLSQLATWKADASVKLTLLAALCGLGGGCIALQNLALLRPMGVRAWEYLLVRAMAAGETALFAWLQLRAGWTTPGPDRLAPFALAALAAACLAFAPVVFGKKIAN